MIKVLVADNDPACRLNIRSCLAGEPDVEIVRECGNGHDALEQIVVTRPDVVFLSAEIPALSGLDLLQSPLITVRPYTVVMSSDDAHAVQAFEVQAIDYLVKPFGPQRFKSTLLKIRKQLELDIRSKRHVDVDALVRHLKSFAVQQPNDRSKGRVPIKFGARYRFLEMSAIRYIEAQRDYVNIHMLTEEVLHASDRISEIEEKLPVDRFIRIHRSNIINIQHVKEVRVNNRNYEIVLNNEKCLAAGPTYRTRIRKSLLTGKGSPEPAAQDLARIAME